MTDTTKQEFSESPHSGGDGSRDAAIFSLYTLYEIIEDRKATRKPGSYTTYLFDKGLDKILKKVGEESTEVIIAGKAGDSTGVIYEISDLIYHVMVLMSEMGITPDSVREELSARYKAGNDDTESPLDKAERRR